MPNENYSSIALPLFSFQLIFNYYIFKIIVIFIWMFRVYMFVRIQVRGGRPDMRLIKSGTSDEALQTELFNFKRINNLIDKQIDVYMIPY